MSSSLDRAVKDFVQILQESKEKGTSPYDTTATVTRVEDSIAWVHIPGGVEETPVEMTMGVKAGDTVQVRVSGGKAWIAGNATSPPTDDTAANEAGYKALMAEEVAVVAGEKAENAEIAAKKALKIAADTDQYFWHMETGTDTGTHITEIPHDEFIARTAEDPTDGGPNLLARSGGIAVREGLQELAQFSEYIILGKDDGTQSYLYADYHSLQLIDKEGNPYVYFSDLRDTSGIAVIDEAFLGDGFSYVTVGLTIFRLIQVTVNGEVVEAYNNDKRVYITPKPQKNDRIKVTYESTDYYSKAFTLGIRRAGYAIGPMSYAEGSGVTASGVLSHAEGRGQARGNYSHAEGTSTADGDTSHAEGTGNATGHYSHAEGYNTYAKGMYSHAEGHGTNAYGFYSHAEGHNTKAGYEAHAEGNACEAHGQASHAEGYGTIAEGDYQHVEGKYNIIDYDNKYAHIIGNGTYFSSTPDRSNAFTVGWDGTASAFPNEKSNGMGFATSHGLANMNAGLSVARTDTDVSMFFGIGSSGTNHGIWSNKQNKWLIYGDAGSNVYVNNFKIGSNDILWMGGAYMNASQTASLSQNVTAQENGIVLAWSAYTSGSGSQNMDWHYHFIPKHHVNNHAGTGIKCIMATAGLGLFCVKYVYVYNNQIKGYANNDKSGTGACGIKYDNTRWVLRYVIGV